ncbi:MAG: alkaline phosphatase [Rhodobacteraceae bacterium]|nr:MAG: alkaline phosphatase [Paracoccaceae bacterium]
MDKQTQLELEAAAFRTLRDHLAKRTDVQNIDMMNLAGFCRNCLSRWYQEAANERGIEMSKDQGREAFYGMPFSQWKEKHQTNASPDAFAKFKDSHS